MSTLNDFIKKSYSQENTCVTPPLKVKRGGLNEVTSKKTVERITKTDNSASICNYCGKNCFEVWEKI